MSLQHCTALLPLTQAAALLLRCCRSSMVAFFVVSIIAFSSAPGANASSSNQVLLDCRSLGSKAAYLECGTTYLVACGVQQDTHAKLSLHHPACSAQQPLNITVMDTHFRSFSIETSTLGTSAHLTNIHMHFASVSNLYLSNLLNEPLRSAFNVSLEITNSTFGYYDKLTMRLLALDNVTLLVYSMRKMAALQVHAVNMTSSVIRASKLQGEGRSRVDVSVSNTMSDSDVIVEDVRVGNPSSGWQLEGHTTNVLVKTMIDSKIKFVHHQQVRTMLLGVDTAVRSRLRVLHNTVSDLPGTCLALRPILQIGGVNFSTSTSMPMTASTTTTMLLSENSSLLIGNLTMSINASYCSTQSSAAPFILASGVDISNISLQDRSSVNVVDTSIAFDVKEEDTTVLSSGDGPYIHSVLALPGFVTNHSFLGVSNVDIVSSATATTTTTSGSTPMVGPTNGMLLGIATDISQVAGKKTSPLFVTEYSHVIFHRLRIVGTPFNVGLCISCDDAQPATNNNAASSLPGNSVVAYNSSFKIVGFRIQKERQRAADGETNGVGGSPEPTTAVPTTAPSTSAPTSVSKTPAFIGVKLRSPGSSLEVFSGSSWSISGDEVTESLANEAPSSLLHPLFRKSEHSSSSVQSGGSLPHISCGEEEAASTSGDSPPSSASSVWCDGIKIALGSIANHSQVTFSNLNISIRSVGTPANNIPNSKGIVIMTRHIKNTTVTPKLTSALYVSGGSTLEFKYCRVELSHHHNTSMSTSGSDAPPPLAGHYMHGIALHSQKKLLDSNSYTQPPVSFSQGSHLHFHNCSVDVRVSGNMALSPPTQTTATTEISQVSSGILLGDDFSIESESTIAVSQSQLLVASNCTIEASQSNEANSSASLVAGFIVSRLLRLNPGTRLMFHSKNKVHVTALSEEMAGLYLNRTALHTGSAISFCNTLESKFAQESSSSSKDLPPKDIESEISVRSGSGPAQVPSATAVKFKEIGCSGCRILIGDEGTKIDVVDPNPPTFFKMIDKAPQFSAIAFGPSKTIILDAIVVFRPRVSNVETSGHGANVRMFGMYRSVFRNSSALFGVQRLPTPRDDTLGILEPEQRLPHYDVRGGATASSVDFDVKHFEMATIHHANCRLQLLSNGNVTATRISTTASSSSAASPWSGRTLAVNVSFVNSPNITLQGVGTALLQTNTFVGDTISISKTAESINTTTVSTFCGISLLVGDSNVHAAKIASSNNTTHSRVSHFSTWDFKTTIETIVDGVNKHLKLIKVSPLTTFWGPLSSIAITLNNSSNITVNEGVEVASMLRLWSEGLPAPPTVSLEQRLQVVINSSTLSVPVSTSMSSDGTPWVHGCARGKKSSGDAPTQAHYLVSSGRQLLQHQPLTAPVNDVFVEAMNVTILDSTLMQVEAPPSKSDARLEAPSSWAPMPVGGWCGVITPPAATSTTAAASPPPLVNGSRFIDLRCIMTSSSKPINATVNSTVVVALPPPPLHYRDLARYPEDQLKAFLGDADVPPTQVVTIEGCTPPTGSPSLSISRSGSHFSPSQTLATTASVSFSRTSSDNSASVSKPQEDVTPSSSVSVGPPTRSPTTTPTGGTPTLASTRSGTWRTGSQSAENTTNTTQLTSNTETVSKSNNGSSSSRTVLDRHLSQSVRPTVSHTSGMKRSDSPSSTPSVSTQRSRVVSRSQQRTVTSSTTKSKTVRVLPQPTMPSHTATLPTTPAPPPSSGPRNGLYLVHFEMAFASLSVKAFLANFEQIRNLTARALQVPKDNITLEAVFEGSAIGRMAVGSALRRSEVEDTLGRETSSESSSDLVKVYGAQNARVISIDCSRACSEQGTLSTSLNANGTACECTCKGQFTGAQCDVCPTIYGGSECDRCAGNLTGYPICATCAEPVSRKQQTIGTTTIGSSGFEFTQLCAAVDEVAVAIQEADRKCEQLHCDCVGGIFATASGKCFHHFQPKGCMSQFCLGQKRECLRTSYSTALRRTSTIQDACRGDDRLLPAFFETKRQWCHFNLCSKEGTASATNTGDINDSNNSDYGSCSTEMMYSSCGEDAGRAWSGAADGKNGVLMLYCLVFSVLVLLL